MEIASPRPVPRRALVLAGAALVTLVGVHLLPGAGGVDPVRDLMSEYPVRTEGPGIAYTFALLGANAAVVLMGMRWMRHGLLRARPVATTLLAVWCVSLLGLTVFLKDPAGGPSTWFGTVHMLFTVANFVSLPALCTLLWWSHRGQSRWRGHATAAGIVAGLTAACVLPFAMVLLASSEPGSLTNAALGLVERGVVILDVVAIVALARWSQAMAQDRTARPAIPGPAPAPF